MEEPDPILQDVAAVVSESMGQGAGEDFYSLYKFEERTQILEGAEALLTSLLGPDMIQKKLSKVKAKK